MSSSISPRSRWTASRRSPRARKWSSRFPPERKGCTPRTSSASDRSFVAPNTILALAGYEADDVIGTLARRAVEANVNVVVVSGDKDFQQLVGELLACGLV